MPVNLVHVYNSSVKDKNIGYGNGFRLNYHQTIEPVEISGEDYYRYTDGDGTIHYFYYDDDKSQWIIDSGLKFTLTIGSVSNEKIYGQGYCKSKNLFLTVRVNL